MNNSYKIDIFKNKKLNSHSKINKKCTFSQEKSRPKFSKSDFIDSDEDCAIIEMSSDDGHTKVPISTKVIKCNDYNEVNTSKLLVNSESKKATFNNFKSSGVYETAKEKYELLNALDNYYTANNEIRGINSPNLAGICQDMCPEKERYLREIDDNISIFEKDENNQFDHRKAVKNYERSAADQKDPPPYELRDTAILDQTMNYLIRNIVDSNISWRQWYNFLATRIRSIRKDITQQNLTNFTIVKILEAMARFHIFSGARLCEESVDDFEKKYNDDELKNCLQSLKSQYQDLPKNSCHNEAEFRSYMIMINLGNIETLYETEELTDEIYKSKEVKFAKQVIHAYNSHNYLRFFVLLQRADFITSCLLHRFIIPARLSALSIINKAYVANKSGENQVPLGYFCEILGFEDMDEARKFCYDIGFMLSPDCGIILNNSVIPKNAEEFMKRSFKLVENKQGDKKLSYFITRDENFDYNYELKPCKMISFNNKNQYIGSLRIPVKNSYELKSNKESSKDNFDLSDSDFPLLSKSNQNDNTKSNFAESTTNKQHTSESYISHRQNKGVSFSSLSSQNPEMSKTALSPNIFSNNNSQSNNDHPKLFSLTSNSNELTKIKFYIPQDVQNDEPILSKKEINNISDNIVIELFEELQREQCIKYMNQEQMKMIECRRIENDILKEILTETVTDVSHNIVENYRNMISEQLLNDIIFFISEDVCQVTKDALTKKKISIDKQNHTLKRRYFDNWHNFTMLEVKERKSMVKIPACPRLTDDFNICEQFRGKVRKISTEHFVTGNDYWSNHPVMARLDQATQQRENMPRKGIKKNSLTQTNISNANIKNIKINEFIRSFIKERFLNVLDNQLAILELAIQVNPSPETIITDYNNLIDSINVITISNGNVSIDGFAKLPIIRLDTLPLSNWIDFINNVLIKLDIPYNYRNQLFEDIIWTLTCLNSHKLPELSYYHLRLFPWIKIIKRAIVNKLWIIDRNLNHIEMKLDLNMISKEQNRFQFENTSDGLSLSKCENECNLHIGSYRQRVIKSPKIRNSKRISAFNDFINKVTELEMKIDECK